MINAETVNLAASVELGDKHGDKHGDTGGQFQFS